jgi:hypothetical protein
MSNLIYLAIATVAAYFVAHFTIEVPFAVWEQAITKVMGF